MSRVKRINRKKQPRIIPVGTVGNWKICARSCVVCARIKVGTTFSSKEKEKDDIATFAPHGINIRDELGLGRAVWTDIFTGRLCTQIPPAQLSLSRGLEVAQARLIAKAVRDKANLTELSNISSGLQMILEELEKAGKRDILGAMEENEEPETDEEDEDEALAGEEGEDHLFSHRAKLYVWSRKVWRERGVGEFKILRNPETGKVRFLVRREQVLKICCNHHLYPSMDFKPLSSSSWFMTFLDQFGPFSSSDSAWFWTAPDFSEGKIVNRVFAVRFSTPEVAKQWKMIVEYCQKKLAESSLIKSPARQQEGVDRSEEGP